MWLVKFSKQAAKDAKKLKSAKLDMKAKSLIEIVREDPFTSQPSYETLVGNLSGLYSRRINIQHRLVYRVIPGPISQDEITYEVIVKVVCMWTHYKTL